MGLIKSKFFPFFKGVKKALSSFFSFLKLEKRSNFASRQTDFDKKVVYSLSKTKIPTIRQIGYVSKFLTKKEIWLIRFLSIVIILSTAFLSVVFYRGHLRVLPIFGGDYTEALVGAPQHINPLYSSINDVDSDLAYLVFSSLFRYDNNGNLTEDLVSESVESEDGKEYTFSLKDGVFWHNGSLLTADDVVFTFKAIKNQAYYSPLRSSFSGVNIEKVENLKVKFILSEKYSPFPSLLTFGIMPQELWSKISPEATSLSGMNLKPIGSGPYKFKSLIKDKTGNVKAYNLEANSDYYGDRPFIKNLTFEFFVNFTEAINALNNNNVDGLSYLPYVNKDDLVSKDALDIHRLRMPQIDSIFFNRDSSNKALKELSVRKALAYSLSKDEIVSSVLAGDAEVASEPFVRFSFAFQEGEDKYGFDLTKAKEALEAGKWLDFIVSEEDISAIKAKQTAILEKTVASSTKEEGEIEKLSAEEEMKISLGAGTWRARGEDGSREYLFVNLTTIEDDRQIRTVEKIKEQWEKIGIKTNLIFSPVGQEQAEMIETRNFEALFYSQFLGSDPDSYVFWHSTQAGKNGLNLSNYANDKVDETLEEARATSSLEVRVEKYKKFQELIMEDVPAIFVYSPLYIYVQNKKIKGFSGDAIIDPSDRFAGLSSWYIKTGKKLIW